MFSDVKLIDFTTLGKAQDSIAIIYFEKLDGTIHVYRDGTVVLSSAGRTTIASLQQSEEQKARQSAFLSMLLQMGGTAQELAEAERMIANQEQQMRTIPFQTAIQHAEVASRHYFQTWCQTSANVSFSAARVPTTEQSVIYEEESTHCPTYTPRLLHRYVNGSCDCRTRHGLRCT